MIFDGIPLVDIKPESRWAIEVIPTNGGPPEKQKFTFIRTEWSPHINSPAIQYRVAIVAFDEDGEHVMLPPTFANYVTRLPPGE